MSAAEYNNHLIYQWKKYRDGLSIKNVQNVDRVTDLNRDTSTRVGSNFDKDNNYAELSGKGLEWDVLVINVGRVKAHDGEFIVVASQLISGGAELEWYFDLDIAYEKIKELECLDSMRARGVMSSKGFVTNSEIISIQKLSLEQANEYAR